MPRSRWEKIQDMRHDLGCRYEYCYTCNRKTEHESGSCISCEYRAPRRAKKQIQKIEVSGSKGNTYTVSIYPNGAKYCNCKGFKFRKTCKHIAQA